NGQYSLNVMGPKRKKYEPGRIDFFAVLLIPIDDWYIIPFEVMGRKNCSLHFTPKSKRQKYGEYREAWDLLRGQTGTIDIQACCDEKDWDEVVGECVLRTNEVTGCFLPGSSFSLWRRWARIALGLGRPLQHLQDE
ncbi:MAG: group I intron-associated PD-(D/E)XK endonuclease, partial [Candidatus Sulfotelmatobacter sp.]